MNPPIALSIAGTDPSGGAGIHADLKTFTALGVYGTTAITALVAQNTHGVSQVYPIDDDFVAAQIAAVADDMPITATKTGMLSTNSLVELVCHEARTRDLGFLVVDPVMVATSGHRLLAADAVAAVRSQLLAVADLVTPNLPEAALLLGDDVTEASTPAEMEQQARELLARTGTAVLLKGGHAESGAVLDVLATADGVHTFTHQRVKTANTHGTGCTLSAAITAEVARVRQALQGAVAGGKPGAGGELTGQLLHQAVAAGLDYLARALASGADWQLSLQPEGAHGPVDHLVDINTRRIHLSSDYNAPLGGPL